MEDTKESLTTHYRDLGLDVEWHSDLPERVYTPDSHERTFLYTLKGSVVLSREGRGKVRLLPGVQAIVETGQLHSAVVGVEGWEYIAAFDPVEAAKLEQH